jgi:2'-5' RNA ligase
MTLPSVVRVFFAIDLPPAVKEKIGSYICSLKKKSKSHSIRWSRPENLHVTLQFLAEVNSEHLPTLIQSVSKRMEGALKHSTLTFGAVHLFPNPYRPRVIVLDITPQESLATMSSIIGEGIKAAHYEIEKRPFRAHLTLDHVDINEVVLFRSDPQPEGSRYTPLMRLPL